MATLAYSWTQQFMLTLLQRPMQGQGGKAHIHNIGLVPAQDVMFALILWYVAKSIFRS